MAYGTGYDLGGWLARTFDPSGSEMSFNVQQAQIDRDFNAQQAQIGRDFNAQQAQIDRDFQERMSNTAYQRAAADMRAAGLNPYAVYGGASAASSPSGYAASAGFASASGARASGSSSAFLNTIVGSAFGLAREAVHARGVSDAGKTKTITDAFKLASQLMAAYLR